MTEKATCAKAPCKSCPYRRDVPSGVWAASEYDSLPPYDGEIIDQCLAGAAALFYCHQRDGKLCAGWVGAHGSDNLMALRLHYDKVDDSVFGYVSPVPLFASGAEAAEHGKRDIKEPSIKARTVIDRIVLKRKRHGRTKTP